MKMRITKKQGRHRKGIGGGQLRNVQLEREIRMIEQELRRRGIDPSAESVRRLADEEE